MSQNMFKFNENTSNILKFYEIQLFGVQKYILEWKNDYPSQRMNFYMAKRRLIRILNLAKRFKLILISSNSLLVL